MGYVDIVEWTIMSHGVDTVLAMTCNGGRKTEGSQDQACYGAGYSANRALDKLRGRKKAAFLG